MKQRARWIIAALLLLAPPAFGAPYPERGPLPEPSPSPEVLERVEPEYPVDQWLAGETALVTFWVSVNKHGTVTSITEGQGEPIFSESARKAVARWKFGPCRTPSGPISSRALAMFHFGLDDVAYSSEESRILTTAPQPLVSWPFPCPPNSENTLGRRPYDFIAAHIDTNGFVTATRRLGKALPDSETVKQSARRWVFRPYVAPDGPHAGHPIPVWVAIRIYRSCNRFGLKLLAAPDSAMLTVVENAYGGGADRLKPSQRRTRTIVMLGTDQSPIESSEFAARRSMRADVLRPLIRDLLTIPSAAFAPDPMRTRTAPEPRYAFYLICNDNLRGPAGKLELFISPAQEFIEVRLRTSVLYLHYYNVRDKVAALLAAAYPEDFGAAPAPRR